MKTISTLKSTTVAIALAFGFTSIHAFALDESAKEGLVPLSAEFKKLDANSNELLTQAEAGNDKLFTASAFALTSLYFAASTDIACAYFASNNSLEAASYSHKIAVAASGNSFINGGAS